MSVHDWKKAEYDTETKRMRLSNDLDCWDNTRRSILGIGGTGCLTVPADLVTDDNAPVRFKVQPWKFGFPGSWMSHT